MPSRSQAVEGRDLNPIASSDQTRYLLPGVASHEPNKNPDQPQSTGEQNENEIHEQSEKPVLTCSHFYRPLVFTGSSMNRVESAEE